MRLIGQKVDALAEHQLNEFAGERLLTGLSLKCRSRRLAVFQSRAPGQKTLPYRPSYIQLIQLQLPALRSQTLKPA